MSNSLTEISTWFVADTSENETFFPQVGGRSSSSSFQEVYWRCICVFFATSLVQNKGAHHVFYTNTDLPLLEGFDVLEYFNQNGIEVVKIPITYRLPKSSAGSWGNQFYILDVINYINAYGRSDRYVVLDSDVVWRDSIRALEQVIDLNGAALYTLGAVEYAPGSKINGVTREEMAAFLKAWCPERDLDFVAYHGGEIFAATREACALIGQEIDSLWEFGKQWSGSPGFLEEAHFLSLIYAKLGFVHESANPYVKRMWTAFKHNTVDASDLQRSIWHLPTEKKTGFRDLFEVLRKNGLPQDEVVLHELMCKKFGIPRRGVFKFLRDFSVKVAEKI